MSKFKSFLKEEASGWKAFDLIWIILLCTAITIISVIHATHSGLGNNTDVALSIIAAVAGIFNVALGGKGKLTNFFFGILGSILLTIINFKIHNYGLMSVNIYMFVMQFVGFFSWSKNMNKETHEVNKVHMKPKARLFYLSVLVAATMAAGLILSRFPDEAHPFIDGFVSVAFILVMLLMVRMYAEQWWLWILINVASIYLFLISREITLALVLMYAFYFVNSIIMCVRWEKEARQNDRTASKGQA